MTQRLNYPHLSRPLYEKYVALSQAQSAGSIDQTLRDLVNIRASQLNGCAFCLDMHVKEAKIHGERDLRVHHVAIWRESALFTPREKAALRWTEVLTHLPPGGVPDELFDDVRNEFSEQELSDLSFAVLIINGWNRLSIGFAVAPGSADKLYGLDKAGLN